MPESYPTPPEPQAATTPEELDKALNRLLAAKTKWPSVPAEKRATLLKECLTDIQAVSEEWVAAACRAAGVHRNSAVEGEIWVSQMMPIVRNMRMLVSTLEQNGQPALPGQRTHSNGQTIASVFPSDFREGLMFQGFSAEVWIAPNQSASQGQAYQNPSSESQICAIMGAGNSSSIPCMDVLYKLFVDNELVILKLNPINDYIGPYIVRTFRALIESNIMTVVYGDGDIGSYLCQHDSVDTIHITGSEQTHDRIVWGNTSDEVQNNKANNTPKLNKPITSELGCVSPCIVVPGDWSKDDIDYQARQIVSMATQNVGFNCNAINVIVFPKGWTHSEALKTQIEHHLTLKQQRKAYYPGSVDRHREIMSNYESAKEFGTYGEAIFPWLIIPDLKPDATEPMFQTESFCGILSFTELEYNDTQDYLSTAVEFCNQHIDGTLNVTILIDTATRKNEHNAFEKALESLEYGTIGVNVWDGVGYGMCSTTWGAFPKHTIDKVGSGIGIVHNTYLLDHPQKSIIEGPFKISPTPAWFYDHKNLVSFGKALFAYESAPSWINFFRVLINALRG